MNTESQQYEEIEAASLATSASARSEIQAASKAGQALPPGASIGIRQATWDELVENLRRRRHDPSQVQLVARGRKLRPIVSSGGAGS